MSKSEIMPLITQAHLAWKRHEEGRLAGRGVTGKQLHLLGALAKREFLYPADIARILSCDPPTARVVVQNLEKRKWAKGAADPDDARRTRVHITAAGRKKLDAVTGALK
ncbi:MAG TPA: MarR family winged helix-turn-helix transcriptional regulator, partial [Phycisphaerae bacterium]|nr:MarR family winged helix-turn-helix transcriptional regulator [Phycisphaerae bacterium]